MATKKEVKKEEKKEIKRKNRVTIAGYLRENTLEVVNSPYGKSIRGALIISTSETNSHKVQFYVRDNNAEYENLEKMLPGDTMSIANYLKTNSNSTFEEACGAATRMLVLASFDEFASRSGERVRSMITFKGFKATILDPTKPLTPRAEFDIDGYISDITPEIVDGEETGRLKIICLLPKYNDSVSVVDFIAVKEDRVAEYIQKTFAVGDTASFRGDIYNISIKKLVESDEDEYFGKAKAPQYETTFIRERRIIGGAKKPIKDGEDGCIGKQFITDALVKREEEMIKAGTNYKNKTAETKPQPSFSTTSDLDF